MLKDQVLYKFAAVNDKKAIETISTLGWKLETLSDVRILILISNLFNLLKQRLIQYPGCRVFHINVNSNARIHN